MITRVQARNFRSLGDVDVTLGKLTILVGRNGAGKSNFIDVLRFLRDITRIGLEDSIVSRKGIGAVRRWAPTRPFDVDIAVHLEGRSWEADYSFTLAGAQATYKVKREACTVMHPGDLADTYEIRAGKWVTLPGRLRRRPSKATATIDPQQLLLPSLALFSPGLQRVRRELRGSFYSFFPNVLREPQKPSDVRHLSDTGNNLASVLRQIQRDGRWMPDLRSALARITTGISDVRVRDVGGYLVTELQHSDLTEQDRGPDVYPWFEAAHESDGTLRALALLAAMYQSAGERTTICFEEPEIALHPGALAVLRDVFEETARRRQVVITTQSPDLISRFDTSALRIVERIHGVTHIGPLDTVQRNAVQQSLFSSGDILRLEGLKRSLQGDSADA